ncbi:GAP family protein [Polymorphospora rubra]|uniref:GAP family protein n=1 Tax=Polymorphospora rubra TaxID=338584 RepID=UPI0033C71687
MGTFATLLGLAVLDSINFSAIIGTLYLLTGTDRFRSRVSTYLAALYLVYFLFGVLLISGIGLLGRIGDGIAVDERTGYAIQGVVGMLLFAYGLFGRTKSGGGARRPRSFGLVAVFLAGLAVAVLEAATALPYIGAVAILTRENYGLVEALPILVVYNIIFILPCLVLLFAFSVRGDALRGRFQAFIDRQRDRNTGRKTFLLIAAIVGFFLLRDSLLYFEFFGFVDLPDDIRERIGNP